MAKIKLQSVSSTVFLCGGKAYLKGDYEIEYKETALDTNGVVADGASALVYLRPKTLPLGNSIVRQNVPWKNPQPYTSFVDSSGTAYASFDAFTQALAALVTAPSNASTSDLIADKGVVTQITTISTGVTLNTSNGVITTVSSTLAADASASITVTNSKVLSTSNIHLTCVNAGGGVALATVTSMTAGSFVVKLTNVGTAAFDSVIKIQFLVA